MHTMRCQIFHGGISETCFVWRRKGEDAITLHLLFALLPLAAISKLVDTQHKAKKKFSKGEYKIILLLQIQDLANITGTKKITLQ